MFHYTQISQFHLPLLEQLPHLTKNRDPHHPCLSLCLWDSQGGAGVEADGQGAGRASSQILQLCIAPQADTLISVDAMLTCRQNDGAGFMFARKLLSML